MVSTGTRGISTTNWSMCRPGGRGENDDSDIRRLQSCTKADSLTFERPVSVTETPDAEGTLNRCLRDHISVQHRAAGGVSGGDEEAISDRLEALGYR